MTACCLWCSTTEASRANVPTTLCRRIFSAVAERQTSLFAFSPQSAPRCCSCTTDLRDRHHRDTRATMSLLDKVPGDLKLYIGGCVHFRSRDSSRPVVRAPLSLPPPAGRLRSHHFAFLLSMTYAQRTHWAIADMSSYRVGSSPCAGRRRSRRQMLRTSYPCCACRSTRTNSRVTTTCTSRSTMSTTRIC